MMSTVETQPSTVPANMTTGGDRRRATRDWRYHDLSSGGRL
jgi:hypothetical protein